MDRNGVWRFPRGSGRQGKVENYCCNVTCGAPTAAEVKGLRWDEIKETLKELQSYHSFCKFYLTLASTCFFFFFFFFFFGNRVWLPKLHKTPYKARFIANSNSCTTTELSKLLTSCLTAVKNHVIRYCEKVYERSGKNLFWSIKNSVEVLNKLKSRGFRATSLSTYDFSTLYTTLPHNLIKEKLINLIEWTFKREGSPYIACNERQAFFTSEDTKRYKLWSCQNVCEALIYLLDNI